MRRKLHFSRFDKLLFFTPILIFLIGILSIYSASFKVQQALDDTLAARQFLWMGVGVLTVFWWCAGIISNWWILRGRFIS